MSSSIARRTPPWINQYSSGSSILTNKPFALDNMPLPILLPPEPISIPLNPASITLGLREYAD
jgi:hypothetical protein